MKEEINPSSRESMIEISKAKIENAQDAIKKLKFGILGLIAAGIILFLCSPLHQLCPVFGLLAFVTATGESTLIIFWKKVIRENKKVLSRYSTLMKLTELRQQSESRKES